MSYELRFAPVVQLSSTKTFQAKKGIIFCFKFYRTLLFSIKEALMSDKFLFFVDIPHEWNNLTLLYSIFKFEIIQNKSTFV